MKITAMLRVKNEARWLREVLESVAPLTEDFIILDDHSEDATREIAASMGARVIESPFPAGETDEVRDKNFLLAAVRESEPDYVLAIDGDEVLERCAADRISAKLLPGISVFGFPIRYVWNDREHYRVDGVYGRYQRASMFSLANAPPRLAYIGTRYGCNFHCGQIPQGLPGHGCTIHADILHLGYMLPEDRLRKYAWYVQHDPGNAYEDGYRHMVVGDVFPADSKFVHGGPLKLFALPANIWPE